MAPCYPLASKRFAHPRARRYDVSTMRTGGSPNTGRKSRKSNQGCTICASCRCTGPSWTVPRKREKRNRLAGIPASHPVVFADPLPRVTLVLLPIITLPSVRLRRDDSQSILAPCSRFPAEPQSPAITLNAFAAWGDFPRTRLRVFPYEVQGFPSSEGQRALSKLQSRFGSCRSGRTGTGSLE